jgi:hypothetical protein
MTFRFTHNLCPHLDHKLLAILPLTTVQTLGTQQHKFEGSYW